MPDSFTWSLLSTIHPSPPAVPPACLLDPSLGSHEYVTANGIKFHYVAAGDKSKPLMLFVHGFPEVQQTDSLCSTFQDTPLPSPPLSLHSPPLPSTPLPSTQFWFAWRHQLREFCKDYRVVAIDMRLYNLDLVLYDVTTIVLL